MSTTTSYVPRVPPSKEEELLPYLDDELMRIATQLNAVHEYDILTEPPSRIVPGLVIYHIASSAPFTNEGLYRYSTGGTWVYIG